MIELTYADGYDAGRKFERTKAKRYFGLKSLAWHDKPGRIDLSNTYITDEEGKVLGRGSYIKKNYH